MCWRARTDKTLPRYARHQLCDGGAALKMLYALRIIEKFAMNLDLETASNTTDAWRLKMAKEERNRKWKVHFVRSTAAACLQRLPRVTVYA